jgi:branched-chain amino acid transport system substrate-binding protein
MITGEVCSSNTLSVAPIIEENKIIYLGSGVESPDITNAGDYIFRIWPSTSYKAEVLSNDLFEKGITKLAILYINNDWGVPVEKVFKNNFEDLGGEVVISESYAPLDDFKTSLIKIKNSNAEAMILFAYPDETYQIYKQIKELNLNLQIYADSSPFISEGIFDKLDGLANGTIYIDNKVPVSEEFKLKYKEKYGEEGGLLGAIGYDSIKVLYEAIKKCKEDVGCIKDFLYDFEYNGASGKISFDENGDVQKDTAYYLIDGKYPVEYSF